MEEKQSNEEKRYIKGELIYTIYNNQTEHFSIAKVKVLETNEDYKEPDLVVKGYFSELLPGEAYLFYGEFVEHKKFGLQYEVSHYNRYLPDTKEGLIAYLSSDLFQGIGKTIATRIVDQLGETAISKILNHSDVLSSIKGMNKERQETLATRLREHQGFDHIVVHLSKFGIGLKMAQKIYQVYQEQAIDVLMSNPYQYVFDIEGFGFHRADLIAVQNDLALNHPSRIRAGCLYSLHESMQEGHVYLPFETLIQRVNKLLEAQRYQIEVTQINQQLIEMEEEDFLVIDEERVYLPVLYYAEAGFCTQLNRLISNPHDQEIVEADLLKVVGEIEEEETISYGKEQYLAIKQALAEKLMILTGGPGTGKTTVIKGILRAFSSLHQLSLDLSDYDSKAKFPFILTAPTGRAAKRMTESTGLPALTIHRLLGWDGHEGFEKNEENQLQGRFLVVDEFSMVDIFLANQLFKAIPSDMQVLLVGDEDQLPSVGPGQVLADLIASQQITAVQLDEVYRQKEGSKIITLAHQIKHNQVERDSLDKSNDFNFIPCQSQTILDLLKQIVKKALDKGFELKDMQILAPMYKTNIGIHQINQTIQAIVNPKRKDVREMRTKDATFRTGDKVIQLVNQPDDGVFNGDIGQITAIFKESENVEQEEQLVVSYDDNDVVYNRKDLLNIMHAYCISIHKSQGSEFPIIVMPVDMSYRRMLKKNLLYTAVTRAKQSLIICGNQQAFLSGVNEEDTRRRHTTLKERLSRILADDQYANQIEKAIDEEASLSPFDFLT
ncbi:ATP-dependent RecD-like DNA helicase [Amphibacillus jilinensis]|uniref:SF1B family DNA helicase RecD2 n=1 Tax=Amphibacillus jilinensis TaxID=1216008 RepID=UPI0002F0A92F|nr:ATP-dependent RecD-like DNA helicase [Amphibacillus jilinensis]